MSDTLPIKNKCDLKPKPTETKMQNENTKVNSAQSLPNKNSTFQTLSNNNHMSQTLSNNNRTFQNLSNNNRTFQNMSNNNHTFQNIHGPSANVKPTPNPRNFSSGNPTLNNLLMYNMMQQHQQAQYNAFESRQALIQQQQYSSNMMMMMIMQNCGNM